VLEDAAGHALEFTIYTNADNTERAETAAIVRRDLEALGMKVNLLFVEFNTLVGKLTSNFEWDAVMLGLTGTVDPHFGKNVWVSSGQLHMWNPRQESPATAWEKKVDELFSRGVQELDEKKRKVYYDAYQKIVSDEVPVVYTVLGARLTAVRDRFTVAGREALLAPCRDKSRHEACRVSMVGGLFNNIEEVYVTVHP
jgi:peptide/nickel transport system substrate-binding protein